MNRSEPYLVERPDEVRRRWDRCPPAGLSRAHTPDWHLERWKLVRDLIDGWYADDRPDAEAVPDLVERLAGWLDPVQRLVTERLFAGWRAMFPPEPRLVVEPDPGAVSVFDHDRRVELRVGTTFGFIRPDGTQERVRLRTGRGSTGPDDAAVLHQGAEDDAVYLDAMVAMGVAEEIVEPPAAASRVGEVLKLAVRDRRVGVSPGLWCFGCDSAARCAQYPVVGEGRVYVSTRSVTVSKTQLGMLAVCGRRVAWDRLHQIPTDTDGETELRDGLATGLRFHEMAAAAIPGDDPSAVVAAALSEAPPSEAAELGRLWENHLRVWRLDGDPQARSVEYSAGLTLLVPGIHVDSRGRESTQPVAVTFIGVLDVTGREADGTPMVVEHRTGASGAHGHLEADLYAAAAAASIQASTRSWPQRLAVHLHHLSPEPPTCVRRVFERADLDAAVEALREAASTIAGWHPHDALSPPWTAGPWCGACHHRPLCETFR